ncbi:unnamed protein product [Oreochromis niloticus]|nr:unnamed protein product [Mustela putorius furo]
MATIGSLTEFAEGDGDWIEYVERLEHFFLANDISDEGKKRSVLLSACGARTYKLIRNLTTPRKPGDFSIKELVTLVQNHHCPKPSVIVQRFKFHTHSRKPGVSVAAYVTELRQLSEHCEFGGVLDDMLRDRLVCGINDDGMQRGLLGEPTLDFKKALEIAQAIETAANNTKDIRKANNNMHSTEVHHVSQSVRGKPRELLECYRCGGAHFGKDCVFKDSTCHNCKKKGHLAKKCRGTKEKSKKEWKTKHKLNTHHLQSMAPEEDECVFNMFNLVGFNKCHAEPIYATIQVNGKELQMEVDTGASASVISQATYHSLWHSGGAPARQATEISLRQYTGECIPLLGAIEVHAAYQGQEAAATLLVVKGEGPSLLGRDLLQKICLNCREIRYVTVIAELLGRYADVFKNELGTLRGTTVKLCVDPFARSRFFKPRTVPYAMKAKVEAELERLQQIGVIEPIEFSDWAAPIVPVLKEDGGVRICGDYKLTVNQASQLDAYPLPRVDDLFATLAGGQTFTKLDMSHAYQQLLLDEESKKYVTINTHKGLFKYNCLVFGVASSPAIFQRTMDNLLQNIPGVAVYLDDILVTGKTEEEHLRNLEQVLKKLSEAGLRLKRSKCVFQAPSVTYLGHRISAQGLSPLEEKVRAVKEAPSPKNVAELRSFLGLVNYYGKFLPDLSSMLAPLYGLLDKDSQWRWSQAQEKAFRRVKQWLLQGWPATVEQDQLKPYAKRQQELSVQDGCILWGSRVIVPPPGWSQIIEVLHEAHPGISRMKSLARSFVWWLGMDSALEDKVKACSQCQSNQKMPPPAPLHPWEWPGHPWSRLHLDFAGPFLGHMFLVLVDAHSKWLDAHITPTITAPVITDTLRRIFATHGLPEAVVTDNGPTFTSGVFQEFMERNGIRHFRTAPYHPASNGLAERAMETLKDGLKKMPGLSIEKRLCRFLFQYRITPHTTTGLSPAELLMGRKPRSHLDLLRPDVGARVTQSQSGQKVRHDLHARGCVFKQGDSVYIKNFTGGSQWLPGVIHHSSGPVSFVVELLDGRRVRRHKDHVRARTDGAGKRAQSGLHAHGGNRAVDIVGPQSGSPEGEVVSAAPEIGIGSSVSPEGLVEQSKSPEPNPATGAQQAPSLENPAAGLRRSKRQHKPPDRLNC